MIRKSELNCIIGKDRLIDGSFLFAETEGRNQLSKNATGRSREREGFRLESCHQNHTSANEKRRNA